MTDARRRTPGWWWPWFVVALLVATAGGQGIMLYAATHDPTFAIEPDYYQKAVAFDTTIQQERGNLALGWTATARAAIGSNLTLRAFPDVRGRRRGYSARMPRSLKCASARKVNSSGATGHLMGISAMFRTTLPFLKYFQRLYRAMAPSGV